MPEFKYHFNFIGHILSKYIKLSSISTCPRLLTLELEDFSFSDRGVYSKMIKFGHLNPVTYWQRASRPRLPDQRPIRKPNCLQPRPLDLKEAGLEVFLKMISQHPHPLGFSSRSTQHKRSLPSPLTQLATNPAAVSSPHLGRVRRTTGAVEGVISMHS